MGAIFIYSTEALMSRSRDMSTIHLEGLDAWIDVAEKANIAWYIDAVSLVPSGNLRHKQ